MTDGALTIAVCGSGKTLFDDLDTPRVRALGEGAADLVVSPFPDFIRDGLTDEGFDRFLARLPTALLARLKTDASVLVFDVSAEGPPHDAELSGWLHRGLARAGVPAGRCVFVTQARSYGPDYARYCRDAGWPQPMTVLNYDLWIKRFHARFEGDLGRSLFDHRLSAFRSRPATRVRRFLTLNLTPRPQKVLFLLQLLRDGLWDAGFVSFGGFQAQITKKAKYRVMTGAHFLRKRLKTFQGFEDMADALAGQVPELEAKGQVLLDRVATDEQGGLIRTPVRDSLAHYDMSWFSLVTETEMEARPLRITEKPFKALANFHPFLMLGNPGALRMVRALGYETFGEIFDEGYDDEPDPRRRFDRVYAEFRRLCAMDEAELAALIDRTSDKLVHNARQAMIEVPRLYREVWDEAFVDDLILAVRGSRPGPVQGPTGV